MYSDCRVCILYRLETYVQSIHYCSYELMESCWRLSPDDRPTFSEINGKLFGLVEQSSSHDYISMLEPSEVPTDSVDTLDTEGTETVEEVAVAVRT